MATVFLTHEVTDFDAWKEVFDMAAPMRHDGGERSSAIYRDAVHPNRVHGVFGWDNIDNARAYFESPRLREKMADAGVTAPPNIRYARLV